MNILNFIGFLLTIIPGALVYVLANFAHPKISKPNFNNISKLVLISSMYACLEYAFKMPSYYIFGLKMFSQLTLQMIWFTVTTIGVILFEKYYLKHKIPLSSYLCVFGILILLYIENHLRKKH